MDVDFEDMRLGVMRSGFWGRILIVCFNYRVDNWGRILGGIII